MAISQSKESTMTCGMMILESLSRIESRKEDVKRMTSNPDLEKQHLHEQFEEEMKNKGLKRKKQEEIAVKNAEKIVVDRIEGRAKLEGWDTEKHVHGGEGGIDLKLKKKKNNRLVVIEAKGERKSVGSVKGRVERALGQIIMDMNNEEAGKEYAYCVAFPCTQAFERCRIPIRPRQQLKLKIIFVECCSGLLKVVSPNAEGTGDAIDLSSFDELFPVV